MPATVELSRSQVIAHRVAVHGLVDRAAALTDLAVLDLGVQDTPPGALRMALSARLAEPLEPDADLTAGGALTEVWSHRGAPHLHRTGALPALVAACWPRDDADAAARLGWQRARLAAVGMAARAAYRTVAEAVAAVLDGPLSKSELSGAVTARIPPELAPYCRPCGTHHVAEQLLRLAGLPGGARLRPGTKPLVLEPLPGWAGPPADEAAGTAALQESYLHLFGPAVDADVAGYLGTSRAAVVPDRPDGLVPVSVGGRAGGRVRRAGRRHPVRGTRRRRPAAAAVRPAPRRAATATCWCPRPTSARSSGPPWGRRVRCSPGPRSSGPGAPGRSGAGSTSPITGPRPAPGRGPRRTGARGATAGDRPRSAGGDPPPGLTPALH